jgi:hypothetical protein
MNPAGAPPRDLSEDEAEAFIGQEGADGFDGVVIDDLDGEGASYGHLHFVLLLLLLLLRLLQELPKVHCWHLKLARPACMQACKGMKRVVVGMKMENKQDQRTIKWRMSPCRHSKDMQVRQQTPCTNSRACLHTCSTV